jgi:hypothetical protein
MAITPNFSQSQNPLALGQQPQGQQAPQGDKLNQIVSQIDAIRQQYQSGQITGPAYQKTLEDLFGDRGGSFSRTLQGLPKDAVAQALQPYGVNWYGPGLSTVYNIGTPSQADINKAFPGSTGTQIPGTDIPTGSDRGQIEQEAQREYQQQLTHRDELSKVLTQQGQQAFNYWLPGTRDDLNAQGQLNSSAYGGAVAREQANLASGQQAKLFDYDTQALAGKLGLQQSGLQRGFSLSDYDKEAALAQKLGSQYTPQVAANQGPSGLTKTIAGVGTGGATGFALGGPVGGAAGAILGGLGGSK